MDPQPGREAILERERRWAMPVALATFAALALLVVSTIVVSSVSGDGEAEILRAADAHRSDIVLSSILQALGLALLVPALAFLFRAAQARSERVRPQLIGLVIAAPLFLAGGAHPQRDPDSSEASGSGGTVPVGLYSAF